MRPVSISLEGFLSYREPTTVDLEGIPAAAIVGPNGAGKTSLVEAVLWCLFGEGRGRGPDDYVSVGAASCSVSFVFELDGQRYRVDRGRQRGRQAKSQLGLFALRDGVWTPVGGDSIAETQAAIERLVGLSAETWLRCSYLAQNQIDAFTRLRPAERKALLAEVLGISRYEALAERARAHERELAGELGATDRRVEELEALLAGEPAARAALEAARRMLADAEAGRERAEAEAARARVALDEARAAVAGLEEARRRLEELRARLEESRSRAEAERRRLRREAEDVAGEIREAEARIEALRARAALLPELEETARAEALCAERDRARAAEVGARAAEAEREAERHRTEARALRGRVAEARDRIERLSTTTEPTCPTCRRPLPDADRDQVVREAEEEARRLEAAARELEDRAAAAESRALALGEEAREWLEASREAEDRASRAREAAAGAEAETRRIEAEEASLARLRARAKELADREGELGRRAAEEAGALESEERELARELEASRDAERAVEEATASLRDAEGRLAEAARLVAARAAEVGRGEEALRRYDDLRAERDELLRRSAEAARLRQGYATLARAFGRDGIPALVIEHAVPEIEAEANRLLERLTDGRLSVRISSLRATKAGGLRETLEIAVADEEAERPLEGFSGGERQCVDLALRIAISRILASRYGRRVETLVLDEAFTALDAARRQRAVEMIQALTGEFASILLITHLPELAEAFPHRIRVRREGGASRVEVEAA